VAEEVGGGGRTVSTGANIAAQFGLLRTWFKLKTTSAAVILRPFENVTPLRSVTVHVRSLFDGRSPVASHGTTRPLLSVRKSGSRICAKTCPGLLLAGVKGVGSNGSPAVGEAHVAA